MAAEESKIVENEEVYVDSTDRGLFDFMGKKEEKPVEEEVTASELENIHVSEPEEHKVEEEKKKEEIPDKLHRSSTSSSSSSDEEEVEGEKKKKEKKGLKETLKEKISGEAKTEKNDNSVPIVNYEEPATPEEKMKNDENEKKGTVEKIMEKLPGHHKATEEVPPPAPVTECAGEGADKEEKKGFLEKIKEKLPGHHPKTKEEKEK